MRRVLALFVGTLLLSVLACSKVEQQADSGSMGTVGEGHSEEVAGEVDHARVELHGGTSVEAAGHYFEVVYLPDGIRVYGYTAEQTPISVAKATGEVAIQFTIPEPGFVTMPMEYVKAPDVEMGNELFPANDYLFAAADMTGEETGSLKLGFAIAGLSDDTAQTAKFETSFTSITDRPYCCPMHADAWGETAESLCPICGGMKTSAERVAK